jgi:4-hydroxybutyryl-CoA dehydratase/vinylacetyl-CoA-Delta-isomerase
MPRQSAISHVRVLCLIENLTLGGGAAAYRKESMHGAGSPEAQMVVIGRLAGLEEKKRLVAALAGVG